MRAGRNKQPTPNAFEWIGQPQKLPLPLGDLHPIKYMVPWAHQTQPPTRHLNQFSCFCRAHERDQQTETDHGNPCVAIGCYRCITTIQ